MLEGRRLPCVRPTRCRYPSPAAPHAVCLPPAGRQAWGGSESRSRAVNARGRRRLEDNEMIRTRGAMVDFPIFVSRVRLF